MLVEYARAGFTSYEGVEEVPRKPFHFIHATEVGELFLISNECWLGFSSYLLMF